MSSLYSSVSAFNGLRSVSRNRYGFLRFLYLKAISSRIRGKMTGYSTVC